MLHNTSYAFGVAFVMNDGFACLSVSRLSRHLIGLVSRNSRLRPCRHAILEFTKQLLPFFSSLPHNCIRVKQPSGGLVITRYLGSWIYKIQNYLQDCNSRWQHFLHYSQVVHHQYHLRNYFAAGG